MSVGHATKGRNVNWFSRSDFFGEILSSRCASILWIFSPSVCQSGYKRQKCKNKETWFSWRLFKIEVWFFFVKICLIDAHLFYKYFDRRFLGQDTQDINVKYRNNLLYEYFVCRSVGCYLRYNSDSFFLKIHLRLIGIYYLIPLFVSCYKRHRCIYKIFV